MPSLIDIINPRTLGAGTIDQQRWSHSAWLATINVVTK
jgi:hypothetical protein